MPKKLFAFSQTVNSFLDGLFDIPINVYGKDLNGRILTVNHTQLSLLNATKVQDVLGLSMYDIFDHIEAERFIDNDTFVINSRKANFFVEDGTYNEKRWRSQGPYFSTKTILRDSSNNIVGSFGLSCPLEGTSLAQFVVLINKLSLMPDASILPTITFPVLSRSFNVLTMREKECVYYLIRGMGYKEIALALNISARTVESHMTHIKCKLKCCNRSDIVSKVFETKDPGTNVL